MVHRKMSLSELNIKCLFFVFWLWKMCKWTFYLIRFPVDPQEHFEHIALTLHKIRYWFLSVLTLWPWQSVVLPYNHCINRTIVQHSRLSKTIVICIVSLLVSLRIRINLQTNKQKFKETLLNINEKISFSFSQRIFSYTRIRYSRYTSTF